MTIAGQNEGEAGTPVLDYQAQRELILQNEFESFLNGVHSGLQLMELNSDNSPSEYLTVLEFPTGD